jgi:hypothetical protein
LKVYRCRALSGTKNQGYFSAGRDWLRVNVAFLASFFFPKKMEPLLHIIFPRSHQHDVEVALVVTGGLALICFGIAIQYLVTSPKQNLDFLIRRKAKIPPTLVNDGSPDYLMPTWKYFLSRNGKS